MNRAQPSARHYLSLPERERLRRQIEFERRRLQGGFVLPQSRTNKTENISERMMHRVGQFMDQQIQEDKGLISRRIKKLERVLEHGTPGQLSSTERAKLEKKARQLKDALQKRMCPRSLYFKRSKDPEFEKAVQACSAEQSSDFMRRADEYKNIMRQLAPDDPEASNMEKLRPN